MARKIGIIPFEQKDWTAGEIYLQNIIRALRQLPAPEQPELHIFCHYRCDIASVQREYGFRKSNFHVYAFREYESRRRKLRDFIRCLLSGRWPFGLERLTVRKGIDVMAPTLAPLNSRFPTAWMGWIPDLQHKYFPENFASSELKYRDQTFKTLLEEASLVILSSRHALEGMKKWFNGSSERTGILSFPAVPDKSWYEGDLGTALAKYKLPNKYLMFPCQFWVHKNHETLFEAIRILVQERGLSSVVLVCSGHQEDYRKPGHFEKLMSFVKKEGLHDHIRCVGLLPRDDQLLLFRGAAAIVQTSLFEGWCLMVEEAESLSKKIYLSNIEVHKEQDPRKASYFDPLEASQLADLIAADWESLPAGINRDEEIHSFELLKEESAQFGREFLNLADRAIANFKKGRI